MFNAQMIPFASSTRLRTWRATRLVILFRDPVCNVCHKAASTIADHIIAARTYIARHGGDPSIFFDENNLQGVCKACHDAKTAKECGWAGGAGR